MEYRSAPDGYHRSIARQQPLEMHGRVGDAGPQRCSHRTLEGVPRTLSANPHRLGRIFPVALSGCRIDCSYVDVLVRGQAKTRCQSCSPRCAKVAIIAASPGSL